MADSLKDLPELIRQRDEALLLWQSVKRLSGRCASLAADPEYILDELKYLGPLQFDRKQRAGSLCTGTRRSRAWCTTCLPARKFWVAYHELACRVYRLTNDVWNDDY